LPTVVHISNITPHTSRDPGASTGTVIPSTSPNGAYATAAGGTEYFMSSFECKATDCSLFPVGHGFHTISVWALTHTASLATATPTTKLQRQDLPSERFSQSPPMQQRGGYRPLGQSVGEPIAPLETNEPHGSQVVYADGHLWTSLNTAVAAGARSGVAYFIATPMITNGVLGASIANQGYISAEDASVAFPAIGVNNSGQGVVAMSLSGGGYYPSAAYARINEGGKQGPVTVAQAGSNPEDGFTCYDAFGDSDACRWGDYSASVAGPTGQIWSATEFIGNDARTALANWSTFVWRVTP
jgi:hypothetical protein